MASGAKFLINNHHLENVRNEREPQPFRLTRWVAEKCDLCYWKVLSEKFSEWEEEETDFWLKSSGGFLIKTQTQETADSKVEICKIPAVGFKGSALFTGLRLGIIIGVQRLE